MQETRIGRRDVLAGVAAGSASAIAGCSLKDLTQTLERAYFNVEPVTDSETADIRFALQFNRGASNVSASEILNVEPGTVTEDANAVDWFGKYSSNDYRSEFPGANLSRYDTPNQCDSELNVDIDNSITGRIVDAVELAPINYSSERATVPSIEYTGGDVVTDDEFVKLQLHDGLTYSFPRTQVPMDVTGQYSINQNNRQAESVNGSTVSFNTNVPNVNPNQGRKTLVPSFEHRAQPLVPALRGLAQQRRLLLDTTIRMIPYSGAQSPEEVGREAASPFIEMANSALGMVGPGDPNKPNELLFGYGVQFLPMMFGAVAGPPGVLVGMGVSTAYGIYKTVDGLDDYANQNLSSLENAESVWDWDGPRDFVGNMGAAGNITNLYNEEGDHTSVWAVNALTGFQQRYGAEALATSGAVMNEIETYRRTLDELETQLEAMKQYVVYNSGALEAGFGYREYQAILDGFKNAIDTLDRERELLDKLETVLSDGTEVLTEDWTDDSLSATDRPTWMDGTSNEITAEIETGEDHLRVAGDGTGNGTISTPVNYTGLDAAWTLSGTFTVESLTGTLVHNVEVTNGSSDSITLPLVRADVTADDGTTENDTVESFTFTFDIIGANIGTGEGAQVTIEIGEEYEYELTHDGNGGYTASIQQVNSSRGVAVSGNGDTLTDGMYGFEYGTLSADEFVVTHDRIEYQLDN